MDGVVSTLRRPEYTGDRRCWPCTVVNVALVCALAVVLALTVHVVLGLTLAVLGGVAIWLRGYFVPGTPSFAPRLVAAIPGGDALLGKSDRPETGSLGEDDYDPEELLGALVDAGVLEPRGERIVLDESFETEWHEAMASLADRPTADLADAVATVSAAPETRVARDDATGQEWVALSDGGDIVEERWVTRPVAIAETAAVRLLGSAIPDPGARRAAASSLRMFLDECPDCGTAVEESTAVSCCGGYEGEGVPEETLVCPACDVVLYTFD